MEFRDIIKTSDSIMQFWLDIKCMAFRSQSESEGRSVVSDAVHIQSMEFSRPEYWRGQSFPFPGGIFLTQGSNPSLLHCRQILYQLSYEGSIRKYFNNCYIWHNKLWALFLSKNCHREVKCMWICPYCTWRLEIQ